MNEHEMVNAGSFTETMSCAIQVTTAEGNGLSMESAFVAGIGGTDRHRHDQRTIVELAARLGADLRGKSAAEIINTPLLVHKSLLTNGVTDLVRIYDECAGNTFFGDDRPRQDYNAYRQYCHEREATLGPIVERIVGQLIDEACFITDRVQATQRLHELSEKYMVQQAVFDSSIDARVFGPAAEHIWAARQHIENGNIEAALTETRQAEVTAQSSSCPGGANSEAEASSKDFTKSEQGDCEFVSKKCPICGEKNARTKVKGGHYYHVGRNCKA